VAALGGLEVLAAQQQTVVGIHEGLTWETTALISGALLAIIALLVKLVRMVQDLANRFDSVGPNGSVIRALAASVARLEDRFGGIERSIESLDHSLEEHMKVDADNFGQLHGAMAQVMLHVGEVHDVGLPSRLSAQTKEGP
jgi:hypothetical protein